MGGSWQPRPFNEGVDFSTEKLVNLNKKDQGVDLEEFPHWHFLVLYVSIYLVLCDLAPVDSSVD